MDKENGGFQYLKTVFPQLNDAKLKEGILIGPQIRELIKVLSLNGKLNEKEQVAQIVL